MSDIHRIPTLDEYGTFPAYVARPDGAAKAAIIVIPEIFGVNAGIRAKCDAWARKGYHAAAPDIFWRFAEGEELDPDVPEQFDRAIANMGKFDADACIRDIEALIHWLERTQGCGKVGLVGYCLGGRMAYLAATRTDIDAAVGYYGVMIDQMLGEAHAIANPLMLHIPTADHFVGPEAQARMHAGLDDHPKVTLHDYVGLDHGFATESGNRRDEAGARLADSRTEAFFAEHLA
ncbi:dienelactone hydrolase family protein [Tsuneonella sp. YG55]|uniref:Dienelactone hydrolase family protein n=1 Tax=Tsuneonella litorea TaxID=2976475 RepID=A0A9X3AM49_9SPHN|nr:dienelactone hydrolase family protein [Tsuneonella litorea]MCT2557867.1 dienelactone hydrolase family protein [Tsuneonella litorea]